jgi:DNA helicase-2/ATP-dependent DNA helicase PcrA
MDYNNDIDKNVDEELITYVNVQNPKSFFLFAGAGSGKTRSLVNTLEKIKKDYGIELKMQRKKIAVITYTNAACDEIIHRLNNDSIFVISTIHSFAWELIKYYTNDIKEYLQNSVTGEIDELEREETKGREGTKTSNDRKRKIENKKHRLSILNNVVKFIYNPNGNNDDYNSLSHTEVISICANFIVNKPLFQKIITQKFPVLLIDESQDTKKELIEAFFLMQLNYKNFSLGLFGDTMQRIYADGKENLGVDLPDDWAKPQKQMNHRCPKRVIQLLNKIRSHTDEIEQLPRIDKEEGIVRLFIISSNTVDKITTENVIRQKMTEITNDKLWEDINNIKALTLEHHMAARRMNFIDLFEPLYRVETNRIGLLDGSLAGLRFFTQIILPLIYAKKDEDKFSASRIVRQNSPLLKKENLKNSSNQLEDIKNIHNKIEDFFSLWSNDKEPLLIDILRKVAKSKLFVIPDSLKEISQRSNEEIVTNSIEESDDESIRAWDIALNTPFNRIVSYNEYISNKSMFGTHQGVKGLEFDRVLAILDDEEAKGFLFSYEKLFGAKTNSKTDQKNIEDGKETSIDRTRRLFYVICSRAMKSLAIVAYTSDVNKVKQTMLDNEWFSENEILLEDTLR